ncbi:MAG: coproporphyrinogen dehydrogenase HemZ, partial [Lachnospiraceae bacterium]|nr:coproporphyrinogen dehydrogenase HemZ [Lachnospiraceae bacterium]
RGGRRYNAKNALKRLLYRMLSDETGKRLPWGSLTGIRPTHIPRTFLSAGWEEDKILAELRESYYVSEEKAKLALEIAETERDLLGAEDYASGYSLYLGIPFCPTTCLYCSFPSYPLGLHQAQVEAYLDALEKEMDYTAGAMRDKKLYTIYVGGGTPTTLTPSQSERLLRAIEARFDLSHVREYTVEAGRPDSVTGEKLEVLSRHHVTRLSINPQSMQQKTLDLIGRLHSVEDVRTAYHLARECGDFHINMDLILGLPGECAQDVAATLAEIGKLKPDDLTIHALAIKRGSRMQAMMETKGVSYPEFEDIEAAAREAERAARQMGLSPYYLYRQKNIAGNYENTGYADLSSGAAGLYNILINEDVHSIVALGAGAISKCVRGDEVSRAENVRELSQYLERTQEMIERKRKLYES